MKTLTFNEDKEVGFVSVDAGIIMVGDPCYHLHKQIDAKEPYNKLPSAFGKSWDDFCLTTLKNHDIKCIDHDKNIKGLSVIVGGFGGDGLYPVYVIKKNNKVTQVIIDFDV